MESDQIMNARISVMEARLASLESRLSELEQGKVIKSKKRDLTPEERVAIRARLVAGQEKKRQEREAQIATEAKKANKQKGAKNGASEATN